MFPKNDWSLKCRVAVGFDGSDDCIRATATALAQELGLPLADVGHDPGRLGELLLVVGERRLELREAGVKGSRPVYVDFVGGPTGYRRLSSRSRRQPIALAVGLPHGPLRACIRPPSPHFGDAGSDGWNRQPGYAYSPNHGPPAERQPSVCTLTVLDATAGLCRDSFLLACLGCRVLAVERCAVLGALVRDGMTRAAAAGCANLRRILERVTLVIDDSRNLLGRLAAAEAPDVVYIDPMYPARRKAALPKKELRICRRLVGDDPDARELLAVARRVARRRVVVKRHPYGPPLTPDPALHFTGKMTRYDVYLP